MVSRSLIQQESTILLHSSGASNSSGSTTAVVVPPEPPISSNTGSSKSPFQLLRRSRNTVGGAKIMKFSNLFRSSKKHQADGNDPTTTAAIMANVATNDLSGDGNDNATISSVIVTIDRKSVV